MSEIEIILIDNVCSNMMVLLFRVTSRSVTVSVEDLMFFYLTSTIATVHRLQIPIPSHSSLLYVLRHIPTR